GAPVLKEDSRAGDEIPDRARDEHLSGSRLRCDPRADVHRDPADLAADELALACVDAGADLETEVPHRVHDLARATHRARRPVERGEKAIAGRLDLVAAITV